VLIRLQLPCLPSGWHPRESSKIISFHLLVNFFSFDLHTFVFFLNECAVMKMLNYFYVWTSEINL